MFNMSAVACVEASVQQDSGNTVILTESTPHSLACSNVIADNERRLLGAFDLGDDLRQIVQHIARADFNAVAEFLADVTVTGLAPGAYYWMVQSLDANGKQSVESEKSRFTILPKGKDAVAINLEIELSQHGHVIEVTGKTETGARVMVNGREVTFVTTDGSFHYFTPPLPAGESTITVTAQNAQGGVNTKQQKVVIQ